MGIFIEFEWTLHLMEKPNKQTFHPIIVIYRRGNFVYSQCEHTSIYRHCLIPLDPCPKSLIIKCIKKADSLGFIAVLTLVSFAFHYLLALFTCLRTYIKILYFQLSCEAALELSFRNFLCCYFRKMIKFLCI